MRTFVLVGLMVVSSLVFAGSNCRLTKQTLYFSGKKLVEIEGVYASSYQQCRYLAQQREMDTEDENIDKIKVIFSFRKPSVLRSPEDSDLY